MLTVKNVQSIGRHKKNQKKKIAGDPVIQSPHWWISGGGSPVLSGAPGGQSGLCERRKAPRSAVDVARLSFLQPPFHSESVSSSFVCVLVFHGESQPTSLVSDAPVFSPHNQGSGLCCQFNTDL